MTTGKPRLWPLLLLLALCARVGLASPPDVNEEVTHLVSLVESSGCEFYRNGLSYDGARAAGHLSEKYALVSAAGKIATGEIFIERVATRSSITGIPYGVKCGGSERVPLADWLNAALARHRATGASRDWRDAR